MSTLTPRPHRPRTEARDLPIPRMYDESGIRFGIGHAALVAAVLVAAALRLDPLTAFGLVFVTAVLAGLGLGPGWRAGLAMSAWAMFTGFEENRFGDLTFTDGDLLRLGLLAIGCLLLAELLGKAVDES